MKKKKNGGDVFTDTQLARIDVENAYKEAKELELRLIVVDADLLRCFQMQPEFAAGHLRYDDGFIDPNTRGVFRDMLVYLEGKIE